MRGMGEAARRAVIRGGHAKDTYFCNSQISDQLAISVNFAT